MNQERTALKSFIRKHAVHTCHTCYHAKHNATKKPCRSCPPVYKAWEPNDTDLKAFITNSIGEGCSSCKHTRLPVEHPTCLKCAQSQDHNEWVFDVTA